MTIEEMHIAVKLELDKTSALELPSFEPEEIDYWLNVAIRKFVKTRYDGMNVKGTSFEQTQKRIDDLKTLVKNVTLDSPTDGDFPNGNLFALPVLNSGVEDEDYWFTLSEETQTMGLDGATIFGRVGVIESTLDEYRSRIDDPYSEHIFHYQSAKPIRLYHGDSVELISDGTYTAEKYYLTYLRAPATVDNVPAGTTDCDMPEHTHDEIVKLTVSMMLENIEQPRYQTYQNEVNTIE